MYFAILVLCVPFHAIQADRQGLTCPRHKSVSKLDPQVTFTPVGSNKFDPTRKTVLIVHGFSFEHLWAYEMGEKWLIREPVNVVVVGWPTSFLKGQYLEAALTTYPVAKKIKTYIKNLFKEHGNKLNTNFHFVGHSLGAHVAGQAARLLKNDTVLVNRVTGLDPAYPCFEYESATYRLKKTDAQFVDVIHTNSAIEPYEGNLGIYDLMGHIDFYPNGGNHQPGCQKENCQHPLQCLFRCGRKLMKRFGRWISSVASHVFELVMQPGTDTKYVVKNVLESEANCDHGEAINYFIESLSQHESWASPSSWPVNETQDLRCQNRRCPSSRECIEMGLNAEYYQNYSGAFYIDTSFDTIDCDGVTYYRDKPKFSLFPKKFPSQLSEILNV